MIESPLFQELIADARQRDVIRILSKRFGSVPDRITKTLELIDDEQELNGAFDAAIQSPDMEAFQKALPDTTGRVRVSNWETAS